MRPLLLLVSLLLLPGCATLEESLFGGHSSFVRKNERVGDAIVIGRDEYFGYSVAYLPQNVQHFGSNVSIQTEWIDRSGSSVRKVFLLDCAGKRYRVTHVGFGDT